MARLLAHLRLLLALTRRDLRGLSSLGLNNLFFCAAFVVPGSHSARTAFFSTLPFLLILIVPLLFSVASDTLARIPPTRAALLPRDRREDILLALANLALSPAFWLFGTLLAAWGGAAAALLYLPLALAIQAAVFLAPRKISTVRLIPHLPGPFGGIIQIAARHLLSTLDLYAALLIAVAATSYRLFASNAQPEALPILALLVAISLSTFAQSLFGLETPGSLARYRLLPLRGWHLLLAKDAAFLAAITLLCLPLHLLTGLTFSLTALAIGHAPSIRKPIRQTPWRFTAGNPVIGSLQIVIGISLAMAATHVHKAFLAAALASWAASLVLSGRLWDRRC